MPHEPMTPEALADKIAVLYISQRDRLILEQAAERVCSADCGRTHNDGTICRECRVYQAILAPLNEK
jgi:hypothetical protein